MLIGLTSDVESGASPGQRRSRSRKKLAGIRRVEAQGGVIGPGDALFPKSSTSSQILFWFHDPFLLFHSAPSKHSPDPSEQPATAIVNRLFFALHPPLYRCAPGTAASSKSDL